ncbi:MAG: riboflavin synthase [Patescibacteria group bacterium]
MFTGIVKGLATIVSVENREAFCVLKIDVADLVLDPRIGGSVSISGVCLTITEVDGSVLTFEVMKETLLLTTFEHLQVGDKVGIETPLRMGDEFGGHIVQGHVDGTAEIIGKEQVGENTRMRFWVSEDLGRQILHKGSIAVDGISLTVCDPVAYPKQTESQTVPKTYCFDVWLLPLTLERTTLGFKGVGEKVNIEVDYMVKILLSRRDAIE